MPRLILLVSLSVAVGLLSPRTRPLASNTLLLCLATAAVAVPIGMVLAVLLFRFATPGRRAWIAILAVGLFFPLYLQAAGWNAGFGRLGWQTVWAGRVGDHLLAGWQAAVWIHACAAVPWATLIIGHGLRQTPQSLEDAALLEAAPRQAVWHVSLPAARGAILLAGLWIVVMVASEMTVADLFLIRTYAEELYQGFALENNMTGVVLSVLPAVIALAGVTVAAALMLARSARLIGAGPGRGNAPLHPGGWGAAAIVMAVLSAIYLVPLGSLLWQAGIGQQGFRLTEAAWRVADSARSFHREVFWSLAIGAAAATLAVCAAAPLAWGAVRGGWRAVPAVAAAGAGLAVPGPLWGLAVIWLLNRPGLDWLYNRTVAAPVLAIAMRCLPLAVLILWHAMSSLRRSMLEAAELEGAGAWRRWWSIGWPLSRGAALVAWLLSLAVAVGDLAASILVMPPAVETASVRLFGLIHSGVRQQEAGLALVMILVAGLLGSLGVVAAAFWTRWGPARLQ